MDHQPLPESLRTLIPFLQLWSFPDDKERFHRINSATPEERAEFLAAMKAHREPIRAWLQEADVTKSDEAMAIAWLDTAAAELEAIESRQSRSILTQVGSAFLVLCVCITIAFLIGFIYLRMTRR